MSLRGRVVLVGLVGGLALLLVPAAIPAAPLNIVCTLRPGQTVLPARTAHGLAAHLLQYPDLSLATTAERNSASRVLELTRTAAARFSNAGAAKRAGFETHLAKHTASSPAVGYLHAESRRYSNDGHYFDPRRPEALIYANQAGHKLVLIGVMFSMPRGEARPHPRRPDRPLALASHLRSGEQTRTRAPDRQRLPGRDEGGPGQRNAARLVHERPPQRVRRARARARPLPRRTPHGRHMSQPGSPSRNVATARRPGQGRSPLQRMHAPVVPIVVELATPAGTARATDVPAFKTGESRATRFLPPRRRLRH